MRLRKNHKKNKKTGGTHFGTFQIENLKYLRGKNLTIMIQVVIIVIPISVD